MCFGSFPNPIGMLISTLSPGDEVIILKGEGYPMVQDETCTLIWKVDGFSALTVDGIALSCQNLSDLIVTGNKYETYKVSPEAMQIWGEIVAANKEAQDSDSEPEIQPRFMWENFDSEPE